MGCSFRVLLLPRTEQRCLDHHLRPRAGRTQGFRPRPDRGLLLLQRISSKMGAKSLIRNTRPVFSSKRAAARDLPGQKSVARNETCTYAEVVSPRARVK